jgi:hypothetical protein
MNQNYAEFSLGSKCLGCTRRAFLFLLASSALADTAIAQTNLPISGLYSGNVKRNRVNGPSLETRTYRMRMNDGLADGIVDVFELDGTFVAHVNFTGHIEGQVFVGRTVLQNAPPDYLPDNIRLIFTDHQSVAWYHSDGNVEGFGTLHH